MAIAGAINTHYLHLIFTASPSLNVILLREMTNISPHPLCQGVLRVKNMAFVVEDDIDISNLFSRALTSAGFQVEAIGDGVEALARLDKNSPRLIVLDLHLPKIDGITLLNHILNKEHLTGTKIIVATADAVLGEYHRERVDLLLEKPVVFSQMRDLAGRFLAE